MNYIYDIYLNFNKELYDFFDWNKNDKIIHVKIIPVFKINEEDIKLIINNNIKISENFLNSIHNKTTIWNKCNKYRNCTLFCDENNVIALEFDEKGICTNKSSLIIYEELEILESTYNLKIKNIEFEVLYNTKQQLKTRKQLNEEKFIKKELKKTDDKKLKYIFFECFDKYEKNRNIIIKKLLNLSNGSKAYKKLYNILKITSTTTK